MSSSAVIGITAYPRTWSCSTNSIPLLLSIGFFNVTSDDDTASSDSRSELDGSESCIWAKYVFPPLEFGIETFLHIGDDVADAVNVIDMDDLVYPATGLHEIA